MKPLLISLHKYIGLFLGLLLSITGISGSLVVFDRELDEMLAPETADFEPAANLASFDLAFENAIAAVNNGTMPTRIMLGRSPAAPHIIRFPTPPGAPGPIEVSIDPGTSEVTAVRTWGEYPVTWFYHLHLSFLGGVMGEYLVGIMGFCMLFFCISGVIIWWPKMGRWRRAFTIKRDGGAFRFNFDLHKTVGIYFLPLFIMLAFTGIEIVWHEPVEKLVSVFLPVTELPDPVSRSNTGTRVSADEVAATARSIFPDSAIARIYMPGDTDDPFEVTFRHQEEPWAEYSVSSVHIDQYSGEVLSVWDGRDMPAGNKFLDWLFPLHNGDALGLIGRWLVFVSGLLPAVLFGTGVYMWWRKRKPADRSYSVLPDKATEAQ